MRTLVVGVGNPLYGDDGVGPLVAERLAALAPAAVEWLPFGGTALDLLGAMEGFERVVVVDALADERVAEGECVRVTLPEAAPPGAFASSHGAALADVLALAGELGLALPADLRVYGVGVRHAAALRPGLCAALERRLDAIVRALARELEGTS